MPKVDLATVTRLPRYHQILQTMKQQGHKYVSSGHLAKYLNVDPSLVRKDLAYVATGVQKLGYPIRLTLEKIENLLGMRNTKEAFLAGAGSLGRALMGYPGFKHYGLKIVAAFDADPEKCGSSVGEVKVLPMDLLSNLMHRMNIMIGIIAVPEGAAQGVADLMIKSGALAIWNFAPVTLRVPDHVIVRNENLAAGYAMLSYELELYLFFKRSESDEKFDKE